MSPSKSDKSKYKYTNAMAVKKTKDNNCNDTIPRVSTVTTLAEAMSFRERVLTSCAVWYCTFTLGVGISFLGASLLELSVKFQTSVANVSKVFTILTGCFLVGAIVCGVLFNHVNRQLACTVLLIMMGLGSICQPLVPSLPLFFVTGGIVGFAGAGYDTAQIVWVIELWEHVGAAPFIQTQHFIFAVGTFVSPLLVKPFLSETKADHHGTAFDFRYLTDVNINETDMDEDSNRTSYLTVPLSPLGRGVDPEIEVELETPNESGFPDHSNPILYIPFLIGGLLAISGGLLFLVMYFIKPYVKPAKTAGTSEENAHGRRPTGGLAKSWNCKKIVLVVLSAVMLGAYTGMEMCSIHFLPTFTHFVGLGLSARQGAVVLSGLTGAFTLGRGIGILIVLKILPEILLIGNITLIVIGNTVLYCFANDSIEALWAGAICIGIGFSTVFPCFYGYIERHLRISNFVGACMIVGGGGVSCLYPLIVGGWIETNPFVLMYTNYFSICVFIAAFTCIYVITQRDEAREREQEYNNGLFSGVLRGLKHVETESTVIEVSMKGVYC